jgi:hypothetical protein
MATPKRQYEIGEPVELQAKVLDGNLRPLANGSVAAVITADGEPVETVALEYVAASEGRYRARLYGLDRGRYTLRLSASALPKNPSEAFVEIQVCDRPDAEQVELYLNRSLLESMASIAGGSYLPAEDYPGLLEIIESADKKKLRMTEIRLWTWPPFLLLFALCICTEWLLRKRAGLL